MVERGLALNMLSKSSRFAYGLCILPLVLFACLGEIPQAVGSETDEALAFFENEIRPALVEHCLDCHATETEASGGLLLDSRDGWAAGGDSGSAIVPGKAAESRMLRAIAYDDPNLQMPPDGRLPQATIDAFRKWIDSGAFDPRQGSGKTDNGPSGLPVDRAQEHWAYRPITPVTCASLVTGTREFKSNSPIDICVDKRLNELGLQPAANAPTSVLVRRLYFDLVGLPPTPTQLAEHSQIASVSGYEALVDRLLASPRFGEHFARKWMDVARYAESITLRGFVLPEAWRYRDYLIQAFNDDRPFNIMIQEQLSGDLMDARNVDERAKQLIATAFLAMGNTNLEQQDKMQLEMDFIDEQLEVIGRAFLGQTIGCARCHDHKFDPIPTRDYYALAGIFRSSVALDHANVSKWIERPLPLPPGENGEYSAAEQALADVDQQLAELKKQLGQIQKTIDKQFTAANLPGLVIDNDRARLVGKWTSSSSVKPFVGDAYLYAGAGSNTATFEPEHLAPGRYEVRISYTPHANRASNTKVSVFSADGDVTLQVNQRQMPSEDTLWFSLGVHRFEQDGQAYVLISTEDVDGAVVVDAVQFLSPADLPTGPADASTETSQLTQALEAEQQRLEKEKRQLQKKLDARPKFLTIVERGTPQNIPIHVRGDVHNLAEVVPRGFLTAVSPRQPEFQPDSSGRRELAAWISSDENPLTARVYANRVWTWLMGRGIVSTQNNFGTTGSQPSHPVLLDWLASELIHSQWSTKHLIRKIVCSDAYKRALIGGDELARSVDPDNQFYWSGAARRLNVEALRDAMLSVSGELDLAMGGSLIRPGTAADYNYQHESTRRSIYQPVLRNSLPPMFEAFDFADTSVSVGRRPRSTVATQALVLTNHAWVTARAKQATERLTKRFQLMSPDADERHLACALQELYLSGVGRSPSPEELAICLSFLDTVGSDPVGSDAVAAMQ